MDISLNVILDLAAIGAKKEVEEWTKVANQPEPKEFPVTDDEKAFVAREIESYHEYESQIEEIREFLNLRNMIMLIKTEGDSLMSELSIKYGNDFTD